MAGRFDAYQQDEAEKAMRVKYDEYLKDNDPADVVDFVTFWENEEEREANRTRDSGVDK